MQAAVLAAGLGTRLRPLTEMIPKTLLPVLNRPLLGLHLSRLEAAGFIQVAVNTHHLAEQVHRFLLSQPFSFNLSVSHEPELLGTGGGLRRLGEILGREPFLAINGDILTDLDPAAALKMHRPEALSTLILHDCPPYNNVWVDGGRVAGIGAAQVAGAQALAYTGVQVVGPGVLRYLPEGEAYDLVAAWRQALAAGEFLAAALAPPHFWQDLGTPAAYLAAHRRLLAGASPALGRLFPPLTDPFVGSGASLHPEAHFGGGVCLGAGVEVGAGASLTNTVVWEGARIDPGIRLADCVVAAGVRVSRSTQGQMLV